MANTHNQFLILEKNISITTPKKKKLISSRQALEKKIVEHFKLKKNLPIPKFYIQGSYKMGTMVIAKDGTYDVDLGIYFLTKPTVTADTLKSNVLDAVKKHTEGGAANRDKCIRVVYKGDFDIDLPVYYKTATDKHPFLATKNGWKESDPKELCDWFEKKKNASGQMVRIVKYMKSWAHNRAKKMPSGIAISVWVATCYQPNQRDDVSLFETLKVIKSKLFCEISCENPASPKDDFCAKLSSDQKDNFRDAFKSFINAASEAINNTDITKSCNIWKQQFGESFPAN